MNETPRRLGVLVLGGPTASGKTELAVALAERFGAEIVGADSRQIYRDMPIGTAAPSAEQRARVRHHLVAWLDPGERYSAARFASDASHAVEEAAGRGRRTIVVGGTGFYLRALCGDVRLGGAHDPELRARLAREARLHPPDVLHAWLATRAPGRAAALAPADRYRVARALEIALAGERPDAPPETPRNLRSAGFPFVKVALDLEADELAARIGRRVDAMLAAGFVTEAERLGGEAVAADALGYPHALAYLRGWANRGELRQLLARTTLRYAKRQRTWFRHEPETRLVRGLAAFDEICALAKESLGWA
ncbi:MAG: tRNA (adenosine(37)-N6)-dimethylallyltransferase MiaA [Candidatus Baltobacteraceae bacterium]